MERIGSVKIKMWLVCSKSDGSDRPLYEYRLSFSNNLFVGGGTLLAEDCRRYSQWYQGYDEKGPNMIRLSPAPPILSRDYPFAQTLIGQ
jgi:hypothetical protein